MPTTRRELLAGTTAALALGTLQERGTAMDRERTTEAEGEAPPYRISLAQWSLHRALKAGQLDNLDFPLWARERFDIGAVEYVSSFFQQRATDFEYLSEMKRRAADAGVESLLIMVDGAGQLANPDDRERRRAVENHFRWIAAAAFLGCHSIRVNAAGHEEWIDGLVLAADSLHHLGELAEPYDLNVIVENHGGLSSNGKWLAGVMERADHPRVGTLPDFGNFKLGEGKWYDRYQGVRELMPWAKAVSAKSHEFDPQGNEVRSDYSRLLDIVVGEAGYHGHIGIEYEGKGHSEEEGIRLTLALLLRLRAKYEKR